MTIPLPVDTQDTAELIRYALRGVEQIFRDGNRYKKGGGILTELVPAHQVQTHLFDQHDRERSQRQPQWIMRCARRSPRDTTRWQELVVVQCAC